MQFKNFRMKEHEAEWKESRRQIKNDLEYEKKQAQRECADRIEKTQRKAYERLKAVSIDEDTYKAQASEWRNAQIDDQLCMLERIDELREKNGLDKEGGEQ